LARFVCSAWLKLQRSITMRLAAGKKTGAAAPD
jgi:hypothetical protein